MTTPTVPYIFQNRSGTIRLKELDDDFAALAAVITQLTNTPGVTFDGGFPNTTFTASPFDAGGIV